MNLVGETLGKYHIPKEIGRGGMGAVYQGHDPALNRSVAIKALPPHLTWEPRYVDRFLNEARTVAKLGHPHIVNIHDVGAEDVSSRWCLHWRPTALPVIGRAASLRSIRWRPAEDR
jgi:serine/threonine protein kinase